MSEPTIGLSYTDLMNRVAYFLGWGDDYTQLSQDQQDKCDEIVQAGYHSFLYPAPVDGVYHVWSFLRRSLSLALFSSITGSATASYDADNDLTTITASSSIFVPSVVGRTIEIEGVGSYEILYCVSATQVKISGDHSWEGSKTISVVADGGYRLPDDFGGFYGGISVYLSGKGWELPLTVPEHIYRWRGGSSTSGRPQACALVPVQPSAVGQRFDLHVYPMPDTTYTVRALYVVQPNKLSSSSPYPLGGAMHSHTILEACLAQAELEVDEEMGAHNARFRELLARSIAMDRRLTGPAVLGKIEGESGTGAARVVHGSGGLVTYEGYS